MVKNNDDKRISVVYIAFLVLAIAIIAKLFFLQVMEHDYYATFALSTHEIFKKIHPRRGHIYFQDSRVNATEKIPVAINKTFSLIYAVPKEIKADEVEKVSKRLGELLKLQTDEEKAVLLTKLSKADDPYESIAKKIPEEQAEMIKSEKLSGIYFASEIYRYYPEDDLASNILGFCRMGDDGNPEGRYGVEGYWDKKLAGSSGFLAGERGALGSWIATAKRVLVNAEDGTDVTLTIDRALEHQACERLKQGMEEHKAKSASLVMMNPKTGEILAMCSYPDFNPNEYSKNERMEAFNNTSVFTAYEPGSVFKPLVMAAAVDANLVTPETTFSDPCERKIDDFTVHNALNKCYGLVTMTEVLENSINTGMIWVEEQLGIDHFRDFVKKMGFGQKIGIELDTESAGDISSLDKKGHIYGAVASYGQGVTATPVQLAAAYSALANGGQMAKPHIVKEIVYPSGKRDVTQVEIIDSVISPRTAKLVTGMLVSVIENTYKTKASVEGYYLAGKTGTAQIAVRGKYDENKTNHTFAGYGPADNPQVVLIIKYEEPDKLWAESTAAPVFKDVMKFALEYYGVEKER